MKLNNKEIVGEEDDRFDTWYSCPECGVYGISAEDNFCRKCGKFLWWEE